MADLDSNPAIPKPRTLGVIAQVAANAEIRLRKVEANVNAAAKVNALAGKQADILAIAQQLANMQTQIDAAVAAAKALQIGSLKAFAARHG